MSAIGKVVDDYYASKKSMPMDKDDCKQYAYMEVLEHSIPKFNPERASFETYIHQQIKYRLINEIYKRNPQTTAWQKNMYKVEKTKKDFYSKHGEQINEDQLAIELKMSPQTLNKIILNKILDKSPISDNNIYIENYAEEDTTSIDVNKLAVLQSVNELLSERDLTIYTEVFVKSRPQVDVSKDLCRSKSFVSQRCKAIKEILQKQIDKLKY